MDASIFANFLQLWDVELDSQDRPILLLCDNFSGNFTEYKCSNINLLFLPANTTSELQPLDGGIIASFKNLYKKNITGRIINEIENIDAFTTFAKNFSLLDALEATKLSWDSVEERTIIKSWQHCGY